MLSHAAGCAVPSHQRADGAIDLRFGRLGGDTVLKHLYQQAPSRVLFPRVEAGEPPLGALVNTAGGLAGGDALSLEVMVGEGGTATLCTPAAEKIYRSLGPETVIQTSLRIEAGARLEWLPQETILFNGARLKRRLQVEMTSCARLLAAEMLVFGRSARGEYFESGALHDAWRLRVAGKLSWIDATRLDEPGTALKDRFGFGGAGAFATLLLAGQDVSAHLPLLRELAGPLGAATLPREGVALLRWLGPAVEVRRWLAGAVPLLRAAWLGFPATLPRLWTT
ncbi:urease accessory protein UreD [Roseomonas elaeocarpi]|uniref:Urease accessory protein UreD n=1 Tax=Roseomonas elaeocarpi TaxID=907779 RepID=A0ABV6JRX6_9PROT